MLFKRNRARNKPRIWPMLALTASIAVVLAMSPGFTSAPGVAAAPNTGSWEHQAPKPTRYMIDGVDMVTATEGWAVAGYDILRTTDGGATWERQAHPGIETLYNVQFFDTLHGMVSSNNTVLYTSNGGQTWAAGSGVVGSIYFVEMSDQNTGFATYGYEGYFYSTNGGQSWTHRTMPSNIGSIQFFDADNGIANSPTGVYHTTDRGNSWSFVPGHGGTYFINHNQGWMVREDMAERTTDGGQTWQVQSLPGGSWVYDSVFVDANNGWGVGQTIVRTTDGGQNWFTVPIPEPYLLPLWTIDFADPMHGIAGGDVLERESYIITTTDGGANWVNRSSGSISEALDLATLGRDHAWSSHVFGKVARTTNAGGTWKVTELSDEYAVMHGIDMADLLNGWTVGQNEEFGRIYRTTDGGVTWQQQFDGSNRRLFGVEALNPQTAIVVGGFGSVRVANRTTDGGNSWHPLTIPLNSSFFQGVFFLDQSMGWIVGNDGGIARTTNGGNSWTAQPAPFTYGLTSVHFSDPSNGWAGGYYQKLLRTTNGGQTWTEQNPGIPEYTHVLDVVSVSLTRGWIVGYGGGAQSRPFVKYTTNGGATWIDHTPSVGPYDSFSALAFVDEEYGWAGGFPGIFRHSVGIITPTPTSAPPTSTPIQPTSTATSTAVPPTITATRTSTTVPPTSTVVPPTASSTSVPPTATVMASATPGACVISFSDVPQDHTFYPYIRCLACAGVLGGYSDGTFRPFNDVTRGQLAKIVANAAGFNEPVSGQRFADVPPTHTFYEFIERIAARGIIGGYNDGTFRPQNNATRGQIAKIVANAANMGEPVSGQRFTDVPPTHTFYEFVERIAARGIIGGYNDGTFRPENNATRGQVAKIVSNTFFPDCQP